MYVYPTSLSCSLITWPFLILMHASLMLNQTWTHFEFKNVLCSIRRVLNSHRRFTCNFIDFVCCRYCCHHRGYRNRFDICYINDKYALYFATFICAVSVLSAKQDWLSPCCQNCSTCLFQQCNWSILNALLNAGARALRCWYGKKEPFFLDLVKVNHEVNQAID